MSSQYHYKPYLLLVLLLFIVGGCKIAIFLTAYSTNLSRIFAPDSSAYDNTAKAFLQTGRFAVSSDTPDVPQTVRTPGYPFFIAVIYTFFGPNYPPLIIMQIFISLGTIIATYSIASKLWSSKIAILAAFLLSLDIPSFINSQLVLTDTLFTFVLSLTVLVGFYIVKEPAHLIVRALTYGFLLSLATLIRPLTYYAIFPAVMAFIVVWRLQFLLSWRRIMIATIAVIIPWSILIGGWQLRNYLRTGSATFSNVVGWNLLFCRAAGIIAEQERISYDEARQRLGIENYTVLHPETKDWTIAQLDRRWKHEGLHIITEYPWLFFESQIRGLCNMMLGSGESTVLKYLGEIQTATGPIKAFFHSSIDEYIQEWAIKRTKFFILFLLAEGYLIIFYVSILHGLWQLIQTRNTSWSIHLFIWMLIMYVVIVSVSAGPEAYSRFRIPVMPLLAMYAGYGISQGISRFMKVPA